MPGDYLPGSDAAFLAFTDSMRRIISVDPAAFGISPADAESFATSQIDYATTLRAATDPATRGKYTVQLKDTAKKELVGITRRLARLINNTMSVSDAQRTELGLTVRKTTRTPSAIPATAPKIDVLRVDGHDVTIALRDVLRPTSKARPIGVVAATVFTHVGETPPDDVQQWRFEGGVSSVSRVRYTFDQAIEPGTRVWFAAMWVNPRSQSGPVSEPVSTVIQFGGIGMGSLRATDASRRAA
jgi:hypothetical protein